MEKWLLKQAMKIAKRYFKWYNKKDVYVDITIRDEVIMINNRYWNESGDKAVDVVEWL